MNRREIIKLGAATGAATLFGAGCAGASLDPRFARLDVSPSRVIRTVAGLRPYRPEGFVVQAERLSRRKTLVHNYGHGGAGVTMSWGSAALAVRALDEAAGERRVAVLGCGVIGLTTALMLARRGKQVTIYAADLPPHTTSNIAAAVWGPATLFNPARVDDAFVERFIWAARYSQRAFQHFVNDPAYGVRWIRQYRFSHRTPEREPEAAVYGDDLFPGLVRHRDPTSWFGYAAVEAHYSLMIDPDIYLRALMRDFEGAGGRIASRRFDSLADVERLDERVVVNCLGLGARALFGDEEMIPVRGQMTFLMAQPEIDYGYVTSENGHLLYMFPRRGAIALGGSNEHGNWSLEPDWEDMHRMMTGHAAVAARIAGG